MLTAICNKLQQKVINSKYQKSHFPYCIVVTYLALAQQPLKVWCGFGYFYIIFLLLSKLVLYCKPKGNKGERNNECKHDTKMGETHIAGKSQLREDSLMLARVL